MAASASRRSAPARPLRGYPRLLWEPADASKHPAHEEPADMTVPEENRPKTRDTDDTVERPEHKDARDQGGTGRTMREALEEAEIRPDDFDER
ncbi:hypothetical protein GCM10010294_15600 [Streptomyces griseoloalbus]|nr:hypothetical protein GCM10010294_15600 [Streptomyces griseoloalbus]